MGYYSYWRSFDREDEFGLMVAEPLRWILFGSPDFDPPAKLWVIQALLLLEMFEKTMTNRKCISEAIFIMDLRCS